MQIPTSRLDPVSLAYLQNIGKTSGVGANGVFIARRYQAPNLRAGWLPLLVGGLVALGIAAHKCEPSALDGTDLRIVANWQTALAVVGAFLVSLGALRRLRMTPKPLLPAFLYADAQNLWDVNNERVVATPLDLVQSVEAYHTTSASGIYMSSRVLLKFRYRDEQIYLDRRDKAEELMQFIDLLLLLPKCENMQLRQLASGSPALLGALARHCLKKEEGSLFEVIAGPELPRPTETTNAPQPSRSYGRMALPWLAAAAVGGLGFFVFPLVDSFLLDGYLFAQVLSNPSDVTNIVHYLDRFPQGRHAQEAHDLRDDRLFERARHEAEESHSPSSLRTYLSDATNKRHREDAQRSINVYYDKAIADLKERAKNAADGADAGTGTGTGAAIDQQMFDAILALLESLKNADRPVATVGFVATEDPLPVTEEQKFLEEALTKEDFKDHPDLADVASHLGNDTAILPPGRVFDPDETKNRERVILDRLRSAVQKVLGADIITLEPAAAGTKPIIEVAYHAFTPGRLYVYTSTVTTERDFGPPDVKETVKGLIRGYEVSWTITIRPPGGDKVFECKLGSQPASSLKYDSSPSDPDWAPNAILLYSDFFDMSSRLIRNFAIEPGSAPESYTFAAATVTDK